MRTSRRRASLAGVSRRGHLRASDQDRDQVVDRLHKAATEGRIGSDELEQRVSTALKARTYGELEATVADLPGPAGRSPARRRSTAGWAVSVVRENPILLVFAIPVVAVTTAMLLAVMLVWVTLALIVLLIGRRSIMRGPWTYARHYGPHRYGPPRSRRGPSSGPGSYWA